MHLYALVYTNLFRANYILKIIIFYKGKALENL